ncbi:MAG: FAD-binding protein [Bacteroidales bacterium]
MGAGVNKLPVSLDPFTVVKKVFSGNAFARLIIRSEIKIITLAQNSIDIEENAKNAVIESFSAGVASSELKTELVDVQKQSGKLLLTDAEIVVSGGRGMKSPDNWGPLEELASLLGGATACSRPVSDEGVRPHDEHTGQTGMSYCS